MPEIVTCEVPGCEAQVDLDRGDGPLCRDHQDYEECMVCGEWEDRHDSYNQCRHMRWTEYGEACGSGLWDERSTVERCVRAVLVTVGERWAMLLRDALETRHYLSFHEGFMFGPQWLNFELGGRWSDGKGGGEFRSAESGPDTDDPETGQYLVEFPVPGGPTPTPVTQGLGKLLTRIAEHHHALDVKQDDWQDGVGWLTTLVAAHDCRAAERLTCEVIGRWLAEVTGFKEVPCER